MVYNVIVTSSAILFYFVLFMFFARIVKGWVIDYYQAKNKKLLKLDIEKTLSGDIPNLEKIKIIESCYAILPSGCLKTIFCELIREEFISGINSNQRKIDALFSWYAALKVAEPFSGIPPELKAALSKIKELLPSDQFAVDVLVAQLQRYSKREIQGKRFDRAMSLLSFIFGILFGVAPFLFK